MCKRRLRAATEYERAIATKTNVENCCIGRCMHAAIRARARHNHNIRWPTIHTGAQSSPPKRDQEASATFPKLQQFLQEQELRRNDETRRLHSHMASLTEVVVAQHAERQGNQSQPIIVHSSSSRSHDRDDAPASAPNQLSSSSIDRPTTPVQSFTPIARARHNHNIRWPTIHTSAQSSPPKPWVSS